MFQPKTPPITVDTLGYVYPHGLGRYNADPRTRAAAVAGDHVNSAICLWANELSMENGIQLPRYICSLLFETAFPIPGIFRGHRIDEGLMGDLDSSGAMALRYS